MKKIFFSLAVVTMLGLTAYSQKLTVPRMELFGGYTYAGENTHGWNGALTVNVTDWFGIESDFSGTYTKTRETNFREDIRVHSAMFGPQFSVRHKRVRAFAHGLVGVGFIDSNATEAGQTFLFNDRSASIGVGGGLDINLSKHVAIRPVQLDAIRTSFFGQSNNNGRYSAGLVVRF